jgi:DNA (cytosine-5)-methyltransferase 1
VPVDLRHAEEIMAKHGLRAVRPLQPATMARIAKGVKRYVLDAASRSSST